MWKAVKALVGTFVGGTLGSYALITFIKDRNTMKNVSLGIGTSIITAIIYDAIKGE